MNFMANHLIKEQMLLKSIAKMCYIVLKTLPLMRTLQIDYNTIILFHAIRVIYHVYVNISLFGLQR